MTISEKLLKMLDENGVFENEAKAIVERYTQHPLGAAMRGRMNDQLNNCPASVMVATWMGVKKVAVEWMDENCPEHWARSMFAA